MKYDVIIGGAGPVGLFLACELALQKLSVLVLERSPNPDSPLKSTSLGIRGITISSVESFYRRGMLDDLKARWWQLTLKDPHLRA